MIPAMTLYALLIGLGASLGVWQVARAVPASQAGRWVDASLGVLAGALVGARLAYGSAHPAYYAAHPLELAAVWQGGLSGWGAVIGGLIAACAAAAFLRQPLLLVLDRTFLLAAPLAVSGWLACGQAGCAYGPRLAESAWLGLTLPDEWGQLAARFPLQWIAALLLLGYNGGIAALLPRPAKTGLRAALMGLGLAAALWAVARFTAEPGPAWNGWLLDAWVALGLAAFSLGLLVAVLWPRSYFKSMSGNLR
jgi:prolipoprotein diacylglyceryltransferase